MTIKAYEVLDTAIKKVADNKILLFKIKKVVYIITTFFYFIF